MLDNPDYAHKLLFDACQAEYFYEIHYWLIFILSILYDLVHYVEPIFKQLTAYRNYSNTCLKLKKPLQNIQRS